MSRLLALLGCLCATACSDIGFDVRSLTELEKAQARWDRFGPDSYVYALARICYCRVEYTTPVRVRVEHDVAVAWTFVPSGDPVPESMEHLFPTIDGLFDILRQAYAEDAHEVQVSYDPDLGYPTDFGIDYDEQIADEELGIDVTEQPVSIPVSSLAPPTA
jgi:hypothetical protein